MPGSAPRITFAIVCGRAGRRKASHGRSHSEQGLVSSAPASRVEFPELGPNHGELRAERIVRVERLLQRFLILVVVTILVCRREPGAFATSRRPWGTPQANLSDNLQLDSPMMAPSVMRAAEMDTAMVPRHAPPRAASALVAPECRRYPALQAPLLPGAPGARGPLRRGACALAQENAPLPRAGLREGIARDSHPRSMPPS